MSHPGSQEWKDEFARRRESVVEALRLAVASCSEVVCRPCDGAFTFGWQLEQGHTGYPSHSEGGLDYASSYIRFTIDQGLRIAVGITKQENRATVFLKAWEGEEPSWPVEFAPTDTVYSRPMSFGGAS